MFPNYCIGMGIESGTCNVCAAPCSSCMHYNLSMSVIGSNRESCFSHNCCVGREADSPHIINVEGMPVYKSRICDDLQHAASETSNLISTSSSHDSYTENAESRRNIGASAAYDASDDVDMSQVLSPGEELGEERSLKRKLDQDHCISHSYMPSHLGNRIPLGQGKEQSGLHCNVDNVVHTSDGSPAEHKSSALQNQEASTLSHTRRISSGNSKVDDICNEANAGIQCDKSSDNVSKEVHVNDPVEWHGAVLDATKVLGNHLPTQETTEGEISESDIVLHDVKVCDICGDSGREDLLAICSKCSDGAEHTYCMREMLDKVPEGDWLCEECKIKDTENQNVDECKAISGRLKTTFSNETSQKSIRTLIPMQLSKLDTRPTDMGFSKGLQSPGISARRLADYLDDRKVSELNGASLETDSPRKKPVLSRQISLQNLDIGKVKTTSMAMSSESQRTKSSDTLSRSKMYLSSNSFKGQPPHLRRGLLSRSVSFGYSSSNPKLKTLIENVPHKKKMVRESTNNDPRKEGLARLLTKSTSFKNTTSGRSNADSASKASSLQLSHIEDLRALKEVKDRNTVERKNFSATGNSLVRPSATIASNFPITRAKSLQNDKLRGFSATSVRSLNKGLDDADDLGSNQVMEQISKSVKNIGSSNTNSSVDIPKKSKGSSEVIQMNISNYDGSYSKGEIILHSSVVQPSEFGHNDDRVRDSIISSSSRMSAFGTKQMLFCQRCNEAGHVSQHCSIDMLQGSGHKHASEQGLREVVKKGNKWREVVNTAISRSGMLKSKKSDIVEDLPATSAEMNRKAGSEYLPRSIIRKNSSSVVVNSNGKDSSNDSNVDATKRLAAAVSGQSAGYPVKVSHVVNAEGLSDCRTLTDLSLKPFAETLSTEASHLVNPLRVSAIPKLECIWQGSFNVPGTGNSPKTFDGIQAHLSTCASPRVFEVATKVPGNVQLEEVSRTSSLAQQFHGICPQEDNIALFFFAKDVDSYERSYRKLMDRMHRNDLVLSGDIDGIELLIFTSNKLPMNCQRWNRMFYLWGMFRGKRRYCLSVLDGQEKSSVSCSDMELLNTDLNIPSVLHVPNVENSENSSKLKKISESTSLSMIPGELTNGVDLQLIASDVKEKACRTLNAALAQSTLNQVVSDPKASRAQPLFCIKESSGSTTDPPRVIDTPKVMHRMSASNSFFTERSDGTFQENCTNRSDDSPAVACEIGVEQSLRSASSVPSVYPVCNQGAECSSIAKRMKCKESSPPCVAIIDDHPGRNLLESDPLSCESRAHRKCELSCSIERVSKPFDEMSYKADETLQLREVPTWMPIEDKREQNCYASGSSSITEDNISARLSPKVHPLYSSNSSLQQQGGFNCSEFFMPEYLRTSEACFFPMDFGRLNNNKGTNIIHVLSSDEEDAPESCPPDLELALGGKKKSKNAVDSKCQFLHTSVDGIKLHMQPVSSGNDGDDESALLSLSLGFPALERERSTRSLLKTEQILTERPTGDSSLFVFSRISNL